MNPADPAFLTRALCQSLIEGPLLIGDLPEATTFRHQDLQLPPEPFPPLDLRQKLGHLTEDALALLLEASPHYDLLARNLQIQADPHTTLGELDFLLRENESGQVIHLELATKFYLAVPNSDTAGSFALPGPDARDNYFKKLHSLRTHQLPLSSRYREHLPEVFRDEPIVAQHLITGCLFDPIDAANDEPALPEFGNPHCRRGRWLTIDDLPHHFPSSTRFEIIPKPLWPVPLKLLNVFSLESWSPNDATVDRCVMLRVENESLPCFVAPAGYPEHNPPGKI